jgi:regulator of RNase E activity RraB
MKFQAFFGTTDAQRSHTQQHEDNLLSPASQKLLHIHHHLGHKGFHYIQKWAAEGLHDMP